jgi:hypothetical protein
MNFQRMEGNLVDTIYGTLNYQRFENATAHAAGAIIGAYKQTINPNPVGIVSVLNSSEAFGKDVMRSAYDDESLTEGYYGLLLCSVEGSVWGGAPGVIASCGNTFMASVFDMATRFAAAIVTNSDLKKINNVNIATDYLTLYYMYGTDVGRLAYQEGLLSSGVPVTEDDVIERIAEKYKKGFFAFNDYNLNAIHDLVNKTRSWMENLAEALDKDKDGVLDDGDGSGTSGDNPCAGGNTIGCDDNCLNTFNPRQADSNGNGIGDACEASPPPPPQQDFKLVVQRYYPSNYFVAINFPSNVNPSLIFLIDPINYDCWVTGGQLVVPLSARPAVGDRYTISATYYNGTSEERVLSISGINDTFAWLTFPTDNSGITTRVPTFTWIGAANAEQYMIGVFDNSAGTNMWWGVASKGTTSLAYNGTPLEDGRSYRVVLHSFDVYGNQATVESMFTCVSPM